MHLRVKEPGNIIEVLNCSQTELDKLMELATAKRWSWQSKKYIEKCYMVLFRFLPSGLYRRILGLSKDGYHVQLDNFESLFDENIDDNVIDAWIDKEQFPFVPRWYQFEALYKALKFKRCKFEIATGGGKSFIIAMVTRYLLQNELKNGQQVLIVTIRQMLVDQMIDDIYSYKRDKLITYQSVYAGTEQVENANVIVGTYQSLSKWPKENFANVGAVIVDEVHSGKIVSIKDGIMPKINVAKCKRFLGFTGTMPEDAIDQLHLEAYFGPTLMKVTAKELMEEKSIADIRIKIVELNYSKAISKSYFFSEDVQAGGPKRLAAERSWLHTQPQRNELLKTICSRFVGNQVILVESVDYAKFLVDWLGTIEGKEVRLIYGGVKKKVRNEIVQELKLEGDNYILVATYETMSTGVSINNIMSVHFPDGGKSRIRIRQSLGRGLRLHPKKEWLTVFDYYDRLHKDLGDGTDENPGWPGPSSNIFATHARIRKKIYQDQGFEYKEVKFDIE